VAKQLHTTIEIDATPERVWHVLTDFAAYPDWNPFITRASGTARPSERLHLRMQPPGGRSATLRPIVLEADPGRRLRWLANQLIGPRRPLHPRRGTAAWHTQSAAVVGDEKVPVDLARKR
jgi:uncharacterized protein YndB with AHSA1/START domain